jgi:hypothetical protein
MTNLPPQNRLADPVTRYVLAWLARDHVDKWIEFKFRGMLLEAGFVLTQVEISDGVGARWRVLDIRTGDVIAQGLGGRTEYEKALDQNEHWFESDAVWDEMFEQGASAALEAVTPTFGLPEHLRETLNHWMASEPDEVLEFLGLDGP